MERRIHTLAVDPLPDHLEHGILFGRLELEVFREPYQ